LSVVSIAAGARDHERLAVWVILRALRVYKIVLSPLFRGSCRFVPSCSDYASEAVSMHGAAFGSWLAVKRLARCHPFCRAGYDPVPPSKQ
jgi:putative membrane protein insertion efficiency factor